MTPIETNWGLSNWKQKRILIQTFNSGINLLDESSALKSNCLLQLYKLFYIFGACLNLGKLLSIISQ
jgi:hypothetical protein